MLGFNCFVHWGYVSALWVGLCESSGKRCGWKSCIGRIETPGLIKPSGPGDHDKNEKSETEMSRNPDCWDSIALLLGKPLGYVC